MTKRSVTRLTVRLPDFLTEKQIARAIQLRTCAKIREEIIEPNIAEINRKLGQENDPTYLAYLVEYVIGLASSN